MPRPLYGPMPGISPAISHFVKRPSISGVTVDVQSDLIGSAPGYIHIVFLPSHLPMLLARRSCILPGVAASMHDFMSSAVQPGGSLNSRWPAGLESFDGSAVAIDRAITTRPRAAMAASGNRILELIVTSGQRG